MPKQTFFNLEPEKRQESSPPRCGSLPSTPLSRLPDQDRGKLRHRQGQHVPVFRRQAGSLPVHRGSGLRTEKGLCGQGLQLGGDIFAVLSEYYRLSYQFALDHPLLHQVANKFWDSRSEALRAELEKGRLSRSRDFARVLAEAMAAGRSIPSWIRKRSFCVPRGGQRTDRSFSPGL